MWSSTWTRTTSQNKRLFFITYPVYGILLLPTENWLRWRGKAEGRNELDVPENRKKVPQTEDQGCSPACSPAWFSALQSSLSMSYVFPFFFCLFHQNASSVRAGVLVCFVCWGLLVDSALMGPVLSHLNRHPLIILQMWRHACHMVGSSHACWVHK